MSAASGSLRTHEQAPQIHPLYLTTIGLAMFFQPMIHPGHSFLHIKQAHGGETEEDPLPAVPPPPDTKEMGIQTVAEEFYALEHFDDRLDTPDAIRTAVVPLETQHEEHRKPTKKKQKSSVKALHETAHASAHRTTVSEALRQEAKELVAAQLPHIQVSMANGVAPMVSHSMQTLPTRLADPLPAISLDDSQTPSLPKPIKKPKRVVTNEIASKAMLEKIQRALWEKKLARSHSEHAMEEEDEK